MKKSYFIGSAKAAIYNSNNNATFKTIITIIYMHSQPHWDCPRQNQSVLLGMLAQWWKHKLLLERFVGRFGRFCRQYRDLSTESRLGNTRSLLGAMLFSLAQSNDFERAAQLDLESKWFCKNNNNGEGKYKHPTLPVLLLATTYGIRKLQLSSSFESVHSIEDNIFIHKKT